MPLFHVKRTDRAYFEEYEELVVRADTVDRAQEIALIGAFSYNDQPEPFSGFKPDGSNIIVMPVEADGDEGVVIARFNAG